MATGGQNPTPQPAVLTYRANKADLRLCVRSLLLRLLVQFPALMIWSAA